MDAPSLQGFLTFLVTRIRLQTYIRPSDAQCALALMEYAGWNLNNSASSKLVIHVRFNQPRSYLSSHQRLIAQATCEKNFVLSRLLPAAGIKFAFPTDA